jgi:hypothetical protein
MNVNSRGHNLDTKFEQFILEIKHPPGINTRWVYPPPRVSLKSINTPRTDLRGAGQHYRIMKHGLRRKRTGGNGAAVRSG